jgi:hypothetical protein
VFALCLQFWTVTNFVPTYLPAGKISECSFDSVRLRVAVLLGGLLGMVLSLSLGRSS